MMIYRWVSKCRKEKLKEAFVFFIILLIFTLLAVYRAGYGNEQSSLNMGISHVVLSPNNYYRRGDDLNDENENDNEDDVNEDIADVIGDFQEVIYK